MGLFSNFENLDNSEKLDLLQELKRDEELPQYLQIGFTCRKGEFYVQYDKGKDYLFFEGTITDIECFKNFRKIASTAVNSQKVLKIFVLDFVLNNDFEMACDSDIQRKEEFISILRRTTRYDKRSKVKI